MRLAAALAALSALAAQSASAQGYDAAAMAKWSAVRVIHFEAVGTIADKHVQVPTDGDLYVDVTDKVTLSFDWDKGKRDFQNTPTFQNYPGKVERIEGMAPECPTGALKGAYEHFDIVSVKADGNGAIELVGKRIRPASEVAQACGSRLTPFPGGETPRTEYIAPPDPTMLALKGMMPADGPVTISPDGNSLIMKALNNNWVWTFTPTVK